MAMESLNEEAFSTSEHKEENKERERSDNRPGKPEGVWISLISLQVNPILERDEKPCSKR